MKPLFESDLKHILDHTRNLWEDLRGENLFITGGTGFLGRWLLESFFWANKQLNLKARVWVLTRNPVKFEKSIPHLVTDPCMNLLQGDMTSFIYPSGVFPFIFHLATETATQSLIPDPMQLMEQNVSGSRHILDFASQCGNQRFLFTSSGAVYEKQPSVLSHIDENYRGAPDPIDLSSVYGHSKRMSEFLCAAYSNKYKFNAVIARCFAFVGPHLPLNANYAIGNFIRDAINGSQITIQGDGTPYRSYLYMSDLTIWLWTMLIKGQSCRPYNVGSEKAVQISDLAHQVASVIKPEIDINILKKPIPGKIPERYVPSTHLVKKELGLEEWINLRDAINLTYRWYIE